MAVVTGIHPVKEALAVGRSIDRVLIAKGAGGPRVQEIVDACRTAGIPLRFEPRAALDRLATTAAHQGVVALVAAQRSVDIEDVARTRGLLVILDGVEDPHNLGAVVRTAHAAGASAVVIPERRASGVTDTVAKAAAGALEHIPIARVGNVNRALERLKELGYWTYGLDERGTTRYDAVDYTDPCAIVLGGEGRGLHDQVRRHCDHVIRIPMSGRIASLNVSVAAGVVLFERKRRRENV